MLHHLFSCRKILELSWIVANGEVTYRGRGMGRGPAAGDYRRVLEEEAVEQLRAEDLPEGGGGHLFLEGGGAGSSDHPPPWGLGRPDPPSGPLSLRGEGG